MPLNLGLFGIGKIARDQHIPALAGSAPREIGTMPRLALIATLLLLPILSAGAGVADDRYAKEIESWRGGFDADIRADGWLLLVGRIKVTEGTAKVGAGSDADIALPAPAPEHVGNLIRHGDLFDFEPADGVAASIDATVASGRTRVSTEPGSGKIAVGGLSLAVRRIGDDYYLNIENPTSPAVAQFKGSTWFPIDPNYRVVARFLPYDKAEEVVLALTFENASKTFKSTGEVAFDVGGQPMKLKTLLLDDELFLIFQDQTNGVDTYGGGRFLSAPMPENGITTLDFNKAFNPYCALNPNVMCPLCPASNRLPARIAAGATFHH